MPTRRVWPRAAVRARRRGGVTRRSARRSSAAAVPPRCAPPPVDAPARAPHVPPPARPPPCHRSGHMALRCRALQGLENTRARGGRAAGRRAPWPAAAACTGGCTARWEQGERGCTGIDGGIGRGRALQRVRPTQRAAGRDVGAPSGRGPRAARAWARRGRPGLRPRGANGRPRGRSGMQGLGGRAARRGRGGRARGCAACRRGRGARAWAARVWVG
jgi:hypothetical protein